MSNTRKQSVKGEDKRDRRRRNRERQRFEDERTAKEIGAFMNVRLVGTNPHDISEEGGNDDGLQLSEKEV